MGVSFHTTRNVFRWSLLSLVILFAFLVSEFCWSGTKFSLCSVQHSSGLWVVLLHLCMWLKENWSHLPLQANYLKIYYLCGVFITVSVINWQLQTHSLCQDLKLLGFVLLDSISENNRAKSTCLCIGIAVQSSDICLGSSDSYCGQNNSSQHSKTTSSGKKKKKKKTTIISEKEIQYFSGFQDVFPNGGKQLVLVLVFTCQNKQKKQKKEKRFRRRWKHYAKKPIRDKQNLWF